MAILIRTFKDSPTWPERAELIDDAEAEEMVKADRIDRTPQAGVYRTREIEDAADSNQLYFTKVMRPSVKPAKVEPEPEAEIDDWKSYRKEVGEALEKPTLKVTRAEVEDYLATQGG